ncbi:hypothetical protein BHU72_14225 [Desulfuribacillus stibiiarsenatis]|uniref:Uncharacterized protein n=1 Tax=Desulfuribacillus stibiiarsenatis TaxID=1390249 RepID=A0A1E5L7H1_9FIRM|nr:hypothetical protein [Desulfuribacillus stibiiarsenatis]OEH86081.1 hypothetical protein BHU72_14225 [Desulfuribacillus stibiiarsenatis]
MKITIEMSEGAYEIAKKVFSGVYSRVEGKILIAQRTGMNEGSAQDFITIFLAMMDGKVYKRAFNNATNKYLLESIRRDYGNEVWLKALSAAEKHINYYSTLGKGNLTGYQQIVDEMKNQLRAYG